MIIPFHQNSTIAEDTAEAGNAQRNAEGYRHGKIDTLTDPRPTQ